MQLIIFLVFCTPVTRGTINQSCFDVWKRTHAGGWREQTLEQLQQTLEQLLQPWLGDGVAGHAYKDAYVSSALILIIWPLTSV